MKYIYTGLFNINQFPKEQMALVYQELYTSEADFYALNDTNRFKQLLFSIISGTKCIDNELDENYSEHAEQERFAKEEETKKKVAESELEKLAKELKKQAPKKKPAADKKLRYHNRTRYGRY